MEQYKFPVRQSGRLEPPNQHSVSASQRFCRPQAPGICSIGDLPRYTVNATTPEDVATTILSAKKNNVRLVIKDTGHDILGRYAYI